MPQRTSAARLLLALVAGAAIALLWDAPAAATHPRFYDDDPIETEPDTQNAAGVAPWTIDLAFDVIANTFAMLGGARADVRAINVNTIDEVPDSSWWTNRPRSLYRTLLEGNGVTSGPEPGLWTITAAKSDGITPGFTIVDTGGRRWFVKFDPPGYPGMATGTEVAVTRLMWAIGYHVPQNVLVRFRRDNLVVGTSARMARPGEPERPMLGHDVDRLLDGVSKEPDGRVRAVMSEALPGKPLGGFRFHGTRPDDPNDVVPHEHRRELRGYAVFAAWLNHVDSKAINTLDTLIRENGRSFVRHHLLDFGSALGSAAVFPREAWEGHETLYEGGRRIGRRILGFGFIAPPWRSVGYFESPAVGRFLRDNTAWDPDAWRPRVTNAAFRHARADDKFWAARKLALITDDLIAAAIDAGEFSDAESEAFLVRALAERRDAILRKYFRAINPVVEPALDASAVLTFRNAAVDARVAPPPASYQAEWFAFDNATGESEPLGASSGRDERLAAPVPLPGGIIRIAVRAIGSEHRAWEEPVNAYFRQHAKGWKLVGLFRLPR